MCIICGYVKIKEILLGELISQKGTIKVNHMEKRTKRVAYFLAFILILAMEVYIALFVHDAFVRPYVGDALVVVVIYFFVRIFITEACRLLPFYVFVFAAGVEALQYIHIVERLGLEGNVFLRTLIGTSFDWMDILCYGVGCMLLALWEVYLWKRFNTAAEEKQDGI